MWLLSLVVIVVSVSVRVVAAIRSSITVEASSLGLLSLLSLDEFFEFGGSDVELVEDQFNGLSIDLLLLLGEYRADEANCQKVNNY